MRNQLLLHVAIAVVGLTLAGRVTAQTFTTLHSFTPASFDGTNSDGGYPYAELISSGNTLFGTANSGGGSNKGTLFKVNTDGTGFTNLHSFTATSDSYPYANSDGANPYAGLVLSGITLYGAASAGGASGSGVVFAITTNGTAFTNLYSFTATPPFPGPYTNSDGAAPNGGLILSANTLYGTARSGGSSGSGTVFAVSTNGAEFTNLYMFGATTGYPSFINSDGAAPNADLILLGKTLYGTTMSGGSSGNGTVFAINTDGTGFTNLHSFSTTYYNVGHYTNNEGANPRAGLILSNNTLYGTASTGGKWAYGTVFKLNIDGTGFTNLHSFTATQYYPSYYTNGDGATPWGGLLLLGNTLYGTASDGGTLGHGTVFAINTDGTAFTNLHNLRDSDGTVPRAGLILSGGRLYGTAFGGGSSGNGTVFSISFTPQLTIFPSGPRVILRWPTNCAGFDYTGFTLQSTTDLLLPAWTTNPPAPVVVNGQNTVTNPISGTQQFFRLIQ